MLCDVRKVRVNGENSGIFEMNVKKISDRFRCMATAGPMPAIGVVINMPVHAMLRFCKDVICLCCEFLKKAISSVSVCLKFLHVLCVCLFKIPSCVVRFCVPVLVPSNHAFLFSLLHVFSRECLLNW